MPRSYFAGALMLGVVIATPGCAGDDAASGGAAAEALPSPEPGEVFEISELAPGVFAAIVVPNPSAYAFANSLVVIGTEGVTVVDTQQSPAAAGALLTEIGRRTRLPVTRVINTHWHGDHVWGNQVYVDANPDVEIIGHESLAEDLATVGRERLQEELATLPPSIEQRLGWLESRIGPSGDSLADEQLAALQRSVDLRTRYLEQLRGLRVMLPTATVADRMEIHDGHRTIEIHHFGPAHTRGDLVVYLREERIAAVGDLIEEGLPWTDGSSPLSWASVLDRVADLDFALLLPSHGTVQRDRVLVEAQRGAFRSITDQVDLHFESGASEQQTVDRVTLDEYREYFTGGESIRDDGFDGWVATTVRHAWQERASRSQ